MLNDAMFVIIIILAAIACLVYCQAQIEGRL